MVFTPIFTIFCFLLEAGPSPSRKNTKFLLGDFIPDLTSGYQNNKKESKSIKSYDKQKKKIKESMQQNKG